LAVPVGKGMAALLSTGVRSAFYPEFNQLSRQLNGLPLHSAESRNREFRNPQGVSMKLGNFLSLDPHYAGKGLSRGGKLGQEVWNEFAEDTARLNRTAASIGQGATLLAETRAEYSIVSDEEEFP
jgi:5-methylcytosine-specific restriction protein A